MSDPTSNPFEGLTAMFKEQMDKLNATQLKLDTEILRKGWVSDLDRFKKVKNIVEAQVQSEVTEDEMLKAISAATRGGEAVNRMLSVFADEYETQPFTKRELYSILVQFMSIINSSAHKGGTAIETVMAIQDASAATVQMCRHIGMGAMMNDLKKVIDDPNSNEDTPPTPKHGV